jgi:hypothetical protein
MGSTGDGQVIQTQRLSDTDRRTFPHRRKFFAHSAIWRLNDRTCSVASKNRRCTVEVVTTAQHLVLKTNDRSYKYRDLRADVSYSSQ